MEQPSERSERAVLYAVLCDGAVAYGPFGSHAAALGWADHHGCSRDVVSFLIAPPLAEVTP